MSKCKEHWIQRYTICAVIACGELVPELEAKLDAVKAIREQYSNLIKQERGLVGADTVLDMIDAALEYKQGC